MTAAERAEQVTLRDGNEVLVRPIAATDRDAFLRAFEHLSDDTRYRRFLTPIKRLTSSEVTYFTEVDHRDHEALIALTASGEIIGVARYIRFEGEPSVAEVAVTVDDAWQGRGAGTLLLRRLAAHAKDAGIEIFRGICLSGNVDMQQLLHELGPEVKISPPSAGLVEIDVELPPADSHVPLARALRVAARGHHDRRAGNTPSGEPS